MFPICCHFFFYLEPQAEDEAMSPTEEEKAFERKVLKILEGEKCTRRYVKARLCTHLYKDEGCAYNDTFRSDIHEMFFQLPEIT